MKSAVVVKRIVENQSGLTLVEALLALGLISIIALSSLSYFSQVSKFGSRKHETCRLYNMSFLNRIRGIGNAGMIGNYMPISGANFVQSSSPPFASPEEVTPASRWPTEPILGSTTVPAQINSFLLINGSMNVLQSLYNSVPGICSGFVSLGTGAISDPTNSLRIAPPDQLGIVGTMGVQIAVYDIDTGVVQASCPTPPMYISPRGRLISDTAPNSPFSGGVEDKKLARPTKVKTNFGFAVRARTVFVNEEGKNDMCITEQRFQYEVDADAPTAPTILSSTMTTPATPEPGVCTAASINKFELEVGYNSADGRIEPGTAMLCQDMSVMPTVGQPIDGIATQAQVACKVGNSASADHVAGKQVAYQIPNDYFLPPGYTGFDYTPGTTTSQGLRKWVPCYNLTVCNKAPAEVEPISTTTPTRKVAYRLKYENLPSDCRIIVRTAGVDTAANVSGIKDSPSFGSNSPKLFTGPQNSWDVPRPKCRSYCGDWPTGYFTCAPSC